MKSKKIITWIAVIAIILSFLAPLLSFVFDANSPDAVDTNIQTGSLSK